MKMSSKVFWLSLTGIAVVVGIGLAVKENQKVDLIGAISSAAKKPQPAPSTQSSSADRRQCGDGLYVADCHRPTKAEVDACNADKSEGSLCCDPEIIALINKGNTSSLNLCDCTYISTGNCPSK
jgi:hypothetical protein